MTGPPKQLKAFELLMFAREPGEDAEFGELESKFSFEKTVPVQEHTCDIHCNEWGTKWDAECHGVELCPDGIKVWFDVPWSPPWKWVRTTANLFPGLTFFMAFSEQGAGYYGTLEVTDDECAEDIKQINGASYDEENECWAGEFGEFLDIHCISAGG
jgi:hypothetical protein